MLLQKRIETPELETCFLPHVLGKIGQSLLSRVELALFAFRQKGIHRPRGVEQKDHVRDRPFGVRFLGNNRFGLRFRLWLGNGFWKGFWFGNFFWGCYLFLFRSAKKIGALGKNQVAVNTQKQTRNECYQCFQWWVMHFKFPDKVSLSHRMSLSP